MSPFRRIRPTDRRYPEDRRTSGSAPRETLLRSLLAASGREDAEAAVLDGVHDLLDAAWVALYRENDLGWVCRCAVGDGPAAGQLLPPDASPARPARVEGVEVTVDAKDGALSILLPLQDGGLDLLRVGLRDGAEEARAALSTARRLAPDLSLGLRRAEEMDQLREQAFIDPLTECYNRRGFDEHLHVELRRARRYERPLALMLVDLDGFKRVNDELGHQAGDHVLRRFATLLTTAFRTTDIVSRYGGDEFAVIFPETSRTEALLLAERTRAQASALFPDREIPRMVTASFGVAAFPADAAAADDLLAGADLALYEAKSGGRDRVVSAQQVGG
jgi:diguanylate cyclase (GGDEF)-like protein